MKLGNVFTVKYTNGRIDCDVTAEWIARGRQGVAAVEPCLKWRACAGRPGQLGNRVAIKYTTSNTAVTLAKLDTVAEAVRMIDALREMDKAELDALLDRFDPLWLRRGELVQGMV